MTEKTQAHHHILPLSVYFTIAGILFVLTAVTVIVAGFDFGAFNLFVAMTVAVIKGSLVALYFMHLKYDNKLYGTALVLSLIFLAIFIGFTMLDTMYRGEIESIEGPSINKEAVIYNQDN
ncbi:MAG: cytochrome-c oxidase [Calditrichaeota bacterium]|nr:MAG: cytochrome-c oxidase [Calditrichota bacterium]MBL1206630.1 cytochrome-c oxidase [Calditrichota bacterium]NOG46457.1 cytochrome-c oxidase [Calditrichota bacterium]